MIEHAHVILGWHEGGLTRDEIPPRWMWHLPWELNDWFDSLDAARASQSRMPRDDREVVEMDENELAAELRRR